MSDRNKRHPAAWHPPDTSYQPHVLAAIRAGYGVDVHWRGIESRSRAADIIRGLHRARRQLHESLSADLYQRGDSWEVVYRVHDKEAARRFIKDAGRWNQ